jgi:hypothetical protein
LHLPASSPDPTSYAGCSLLAGPTPSRGCSLAGHVPLWRVPACVALHEIQVRSARVIIRHGPPPVRMLACSSDRFNMCNTSSVALRILTRYVMLRVISLSALQHGERDRHPGRLSPELPPAAFRALLSLFCIGPGLCPIHPGSGIGFLRTSPFGHSRKLDFRFTAF